MDEQLLREFLAEAEDLIEVLFGDIQTLRARHTEGRARRELVGRIFRHIHTVKGTASAAGLEVTGQIAHELETLLEAVRMGHVALDEAVLDAFEDAAQAVAESLNRVVRGETDTLPDALLSQLNALAASKSSSASARAASDANLARTLARLPADIQHILSEYELQRLAETLGEGARLFVIKVNFGFATFDEQFRNLSDALAEGGEVISTLPGVEAGATDQVSFRILYATDEEHAQVAARIAPFKAEISEVVESQDGSAGAGARAEAATGDASADEMSADETPALAASNALRTPLVRVSLEVLDDLISATHELFTDTVAALEMARMMSGGADATEFDERAASIRRRLFELEEHLINLRMVEVGGVLERVARAGRSVARFAGKEIDFTMAGGEVRLDKSLADAVAEPLLHLVRNAVDHAIESSAERERAGKHGRGRVRLEAVSEGSRVLLRVADDGRGVDAERVGRAAREQGVVAPDQPVDERQALRLIFRPGFTTARDVSQMSGRGVGLEVVERAVEQWGGELRVSSVRGSGTTFEMHLPTTLALLPAVVVQSGEHQYCIGQQHVVETLHFSAAEREQTNGESFLRWRGLRLPVFEMRRLLDEREAQTPSSEQERTAALILRAVESKDDPTKCTAIIVDKLEGTREVLVRSLGRHATRWRGVSGATELHDGSVALLLDVARLLELSAGSKR